MIALADVRPASRADGLATALLQPILAGDWRPHDRLPSEHDLAAPHGVSRTVVREAIARLKSDGYVETRQGKGACVAAAHGGGALRRATEADADMLGLRAPGEAACAVGSRREVGREREGMTR